MIGERLKHNYAGSKAWIIAYKPEHFDSIGLRQNVRIKMLNGSLECELRGYELFAGKRDDYKRERGGEGRPETPRRERAPRSERPRREFDRPRRSFDRSDRSDRTDRPDRDRRDRPERGERFDRSSRTDRPERDRRDRPERGERFDRTNRSERPERTDRPSRPRRDRDFDRGSSSDRPRRPRPTDDRPREERGPRREHSEKKKEGGLWPNDRFRYRDEEGRERIRSKRSSHIQVFSLDKEE